MHAIYLYHFNFQTLMEDECISVDVQSDPEKYEKQKIDVEKRIQTFIQTLLKVDNYYQFTIPVKFSFGALICRYIVAQSS